MKNIDFTDFFNVFLSGATIMRFRYPQRVFYGKQYKAGKSEITEQ